MIARKLLLASCKLAALLALAFFLGAALICLAPGAGVDERELDSRLSGQSIQHIRESRATQARVLSFYVQYLAGIARGDFGRSQSFDLPVRGLLADRFPVTVRSVASGLLWGWLAALLLAFSAALVRHPLFDAAAAVLAGQFLCLPSALLALLLFLAGAPPSLGIAAVVFPRVFRYAHEVFLHSAALPHVLTARAKGLGTLPIVLRHVIPQAAPELVALAGVSVGIALGAAIPVEVMCDSPGIGQLAWKAALARDLPLLVTLTLVIAAITLSANFLADAFGTRGRQ
jgi:peptide/nickel transport system permease protein